MAAAFELINGLVNWEPGQMVEVLQGLANLGITGDLVKIGRVVVVAIPVAGIEIFICLSKVLTDTCCEP